MHEIVITPDIEAEQFARLSKQARQIDGLLDGDGRARPAAISGVLKPYGSRLWQAIGLDATDMRQALSEAQTNGSPLRLAIEGQDVHRLPWEILYHEHPEIGFIASRPWCSVTRRIRSIDGTGAALKPLPLKLLLFIASPEDLDAERSRLDYEQEEALLYEALDRPLSEGKVELDVAEDGCLETLIDRLERNHYHAVILSMHGASAKDASGAQEWGLLFEDSQTGRGRPIAGSRLQTEFEKLPADNRPDLLMLSACRSAKAEETAASISSVALKLHGTIHRVLGMRLSVMDAAASVFSSEFFRRLALGESCVRALSMARDLVAQGHWMSSEPRQEMPTGDPFAQWTLPVLYDATEGGPLIDIKLPFEASPPPPLPTILITEGLMEPVNLPDRRSFVGRRRQQREFLRPFLENKTPKLFFSGPGGVGKTALAGLFVRQVMERGQETRLFGFRAPFELDKVYESLRDRVWKQLDADVLGKLQLEQDLRKRLNWLLQAIAEQQPTVFLLDNLESIQDIKTLSIKPERLDSLFFVKTVCELPSPIRALLTGRYRLAELDRPDIIECAVPDAPYGDILRRMQRLKWPKQYGMQDKQDVYRILGGNHRAIEWLGCLLVTPLTLSKRHKAPQEIMDVLKAVEAPPDTPERAMEVVREAMRQNLLLGELRLALEPHQDQLLRALSIYRTAFTLDGVYAAAQQADSEEQDIRALLDHALLECGRDFLLLGNHRQLLEVFFVPPIVRELLSQDPRLRRR